MCVRNCPSLDCWPGHQRSDVSLGSPAQNTLSSSLQKTLPVTFKLQSWCLFLQATHPAPSLPQTLRALSSSLPALPAWALGLKHPVTSLSPDQPPHEAGAVITPILQMRKLKHTGEKSFLKDHAAFPSPLALKA